MSSESSVHTQIETFDQFIEYCFPKNGELSRALLTQNETQLRHFFLALICVSGAYPFVVTADDYAQSTFGDTAIGWRFYFSLAAAAWSIGFFYNATIIFLDTYRREEIPSHLKKILVNATTPSQRLFKKTVLAIGAIISALPLAILTLPYTPSSVPSWLKYLLFIVAWADDAVLHFLPIEFAFQSIAYRWPLYPFEKLYEHLEDCQLSIDARKQRTIETENAQAYAAHLVGPLVQALAQAKVALNVKAVSVDARLNVIIDLPKELQRENFLSLKPEEKLRVLIEYGKELSMSSQDTGVHNAVAFLGSIWGIIADTGFMLITAEEMISLVGSLSLGLLLVALPLYFYGALVAFYGSASLLTLWSYLTDHAQGDVKLSLMFKLFPVASIAYAFFSLAMMGACYGVPVELIETTVSSDSPFLTPLIVIATTNAVIVTTYILIEFYCAILRDVVLYSKPSDSQWIVQLGAQIDEMMAALPFVEDDKLLSFLKKIQPETAKDIGFTPESLQSYEASRKVTFFENQEVSEMSPLLSSQTDQGQSYVI